MDGFAWSPARPVLHDLVIDLPTSVRALRERAFLTRPAAQAREIDASAGHIAQTIAQGHQHQSQTGHLLRRLTSAEGSDDLGVDRSQSLDRGVSSARVYRLVVIAEAKIVVRAVFLHDDAVSARDNG